MTAEDVKYTYERFLTVKGNPNRGILDAIDTIDALDRHTVRFTLKEPHAWFLDNLAQPFTWLVAREAVDRTMVLFDARQPPAGELPVVLTAGASGILQHEAIGHGMEADFNRKNTSIYADMIGKVVAPELVTIVDDGTLPHERGALNVDDEGMPTERTVLVDRGVLASYLHDRISARHYGLARSTGWDPTLIRIGALALTLFAFGPLMILFYILVGAFTPAR